MTQRKHERSPRRGSENRARRHQVKVALTDAELAALDAMRGDLSRAAVLRGALGREKEIPDGFPADGPHWYSRWLIMAGMLDEEAAQRIALHARIRELEKGEGAITEHGQLYSGGGYLTRNPAPEIERIFPLADWIRAGQDNGGKVWRRRIIVVDDWEEVPHG